MKITSLTVQKGHKSRCNLYIDGEFYKGLSIETAIQFHLKEGLEVDKETLDKIISEGEKKDALNKAVNYLSKTLKTKLQMKIYLLNKGYDENTVWYVIDKLKEYGYIDDKEYAKRYMESTQKTQGKNLSAYKLMSKGIKKEDVENAFIESEIDSKSNAKLLAEKRLKNKEINKELLAKTFRYLIGRGFSYEEVSDALAEYKEDL